MGDVINLRQARKQRARVEKARAADANRARFGRTNAEKKAQDAAIDRQNRIVDGARREPPEEKSPPGE